MNKDQIKKSKYKADLKEVSETLGGLRGNPQNPLDISFSEFIRRKYQTSMESYYQELGINPNVDTIENLVTTSGYNDFRFLVPEIIREAMRLGLRRAPIYPNVIVTEQQISQKSITIPHINMSDAAPRKVAEGETIPVGDLSYGQKELKIGKIGRGVKITYEIKQYVAINVMAIYLQDFGVKLGQGIDTLLIDTLINGEQADGSEAAPVIGVETPNTLVYKDLLKVWVRHSRLGKRPDAIIAGEQMAIDTLDLDEFKTNNFGGTSPAGVPSATNLTLKTPLPRNSDYFIHGAVPDDQSIILDSNSTVIKYNAQPLLIESEKIVSNQTMASYASLTTGFGIIFADSRVIVDRTLDIDTDTFPDYMDVDSFEVVEFE